MKWIKKIFGNNNDNQTKESAIEAQNSDTSPKIINLEGIGSSSEIVKKEYTEKNPLKVFENEYNVILDRKMHPKDGSYTNYLFDKGIDKILKKVGEEATEIVIAAKNPDSEEIKYEVSDFLYHLMVMMVEKGVTWEDIIQELSQR